MKKFLIHLLGGYTKKEAVSRERVVKMVEESVIAGRLLGLVIIKDKADSIDGCSADEWCKTIYDELEYRIGLDLHGKFSVEDAIDSLDINYTESIEREEENDEE